MEQKKIEKLYALLERAEKSMMWMRLPHCGGRYPGWKGEEVNSMQEITVAEALTAWEQAGQTVEINDGRCQWTE